MKYKASIEGHHLKSKTEKKPNDLRSEDSFTAVF